MGFKKANGKGRKGEERSCIISTLSLLLGLASCTVQWYCSLVVLLDDTRALFVLQLHLEGKLQQGATTTNSSS